MGPKSKKQLQQPQRGWMTSSPLPRRKQRHVTVRYIHTHLVETTKANFKSVVQSLTGKNSHMHQIQTSENAYLDSKDIRSAPQSILRPAKDLGSPQAAAEDKVEAGVEDDVERALDFSEFGEMGEWGEKYSGDEILASPYNEHVLGFSSFNPRHEHLALWDWLWADQPRHSAHL